MKVQIHIYQLFSLIWISIRMRGVIFKRNFLCSFFEDLMNLSLGLFSIRQLFPAKNFIVEYLSSSSCKHALALNWLVIQVLIVCAYNFFLKWANKREERLVNDISRNKHSDEIVMFDLDQFLNQIDFFIDNTVLKDNYVIMRMYLLCKILSRNHPYFSMYH